MKTFFKALVTGLLAAVLTIPAALAQYRPAFSQEELDQMLAPIALYPDALLSQMLMAATYPQEVVQAARWSRANAHLTGEEAVRAVEPMDWDPSVKSLVAFPEVLSRMDEKLDWTERLGEAFIGQQPQVMDTIQQLRQRASATGYLGPTEQMRVVRHGEHIVIEPASSQLFYVPYYNPTVVYGPWWWPAYPPVYWAPWPGYVVRSAYAPAYLWGRGTVIGIGFFFGHFDWPRRHVTVIHRHPPRVVVDHRTTVIHRPVTPDPRPVRWQHDPHHRKSLPYRFSEPREARPAPPVATREDRRPHEARHPGRTLPVAPHTDARAAGAAVDGENRQHRRVAPTPPPAGRIADQRAHVERPAATGDADRPVVRSFSRDGEPRRRAGGRRDRD